MKPTLAQRLKAWLKWHDQPAHKFTALRPGHDLASIVLEHREEIEAEVKRGEHESEAT